MATSGSVRTNTAFGYIQLSWSLVSQDITNNKSTISYALSIYRSSTLSSSASKSYSITINGSTVASGTDTIGGSGTSTLKSGSTTISHNADGTKTFSYSFSQTCGIYWGSTYVGTVAGSGSDSLTTIPRTSKPTSNDYDVDYGTSITISTNRASTSFTHTLRYNWNGNTGTIATGVATSYAWTIPNSFMNYITDKTSTYGTIYCDTYSGSTKIGTASITVTTRVPSTIAPTFTSVTAVDTATFNNAGVTTNVLTFFGSYIQGISKPKLTINGQAGAYGSTITDYNFTFEGLNYTGNNVTTNVISGSGSIVVTGVITDSRGRTASKTATITVSAYASPKITTLTIARADSSGVHNDMGTYANITRAVTWSSLSSKNTLSIVTKSKLRGTTTWTVNNTTSAGNTGSYSTALTIGTFDVTKSYDFQIEFTDAFNTTLSLGVLPTGEVAMSWSSGGIGVGKIWEQGVLDVDGDTYIGGDTYLGTNQLFGRFGSERIPANADLNNYDIEGLYYSPANVDVSTMTNVPTGYAFSLLVEKHAGVKQTLTTYMTSGQGMWTRNKYSSTWGSWYRMPIIQPANWIVPDLLNGWIQYDSGTSGYQQARFFKGDNNIVHMEGLIKNGTSNDGTSIFVLPAGYRPARTLIFPVSTSSGYGRIDIYLEGNVRTNGDYGDSFISISGISFRAEL